MHNPKHQLTTNAGAPVVDNQNVMTGGPRGPQLLQDVWFLENPARAMGDAPQEIKIRHIVNCFKADADYGKGVAAAMGISMSAVPL